MSSALESAGTENLLALFCQHCEFLEKRQMGRCPKGQTTCGAKIQQLYTLKHSYSGLPVGSIVGIRDIFWAIDKDYATVTIITEQNQRFGVACTLLEKIVATEKAS